LVLAGVVAATSPAFADTVRCVNADQSVKVAAEISFTAERDGGEVTLVEVATPHLTMSTGTAETLAVAEVTFDRIQIGLESPNVGPMTFVLDIVRTAESDGNGGPDTDVVVAGVATRERRDDDSCMRGMVAMMKPAALAAAIAVLASPAAATEWIYCNDAANTVTVGVLLGSEPMSVSGIILSLNDKVWASAAAYGPGDPVSLGQGYETDTAFFADLVDGESILLAQLHLLKANEGEMYVTSGTLRMPGQGAWAVSCEGP
jgi:hypothetical protein